MRKLALLSMFILVLVLVGCGATQPAKDPFLTNAYRALSAMDTTYDVAWGSFVKLYKDGLVKEETFQAGRKLANDYFAKWTDAAQYLKKYAAGEVPAGGFDLLQVLVNKSLEELKNYLKEKSGGIKPII